MSELEKWEFDFFNKNNNGSEFMVSQELGNLGHTIQNQEYCKILFINIIKIDIKLFKKIYLSKLHEKRTNKINKILN